MESDTPPCQFSWDILHTRNESNSFNLKLKRENSLNIKIVIVIEGHLPNIICLYVLGAPITLLGSQLIRDVC